MRSGLAGHLNLAGELNLRKRLQLFDELLVPVHQPDGAALVFQRDRHSLPAAACAYDRKV